MRGLLISFEYIKMDDIDITLLSKFFKDFIMPLGWNWTSNPFVIVELIKHPFVVSCAR